MILTDDIRSRELCSMWSWYKNDHILIGGASVNKSLTANLTTRCAVLPVSAYNRANHMRLLNIEGVK